MVLACAVYSMIETYLGVSHPTDQLIAVLIGRTVPLLMFRLFAPEEVFPISYGSGATLPTSTSRAPAVRPSAAAIRTSSA